MDDHNLRDKLIVVESEENDLKHRVWIESKKFWRVAFPAIIARVTSFGIVVVTQSFIGHIGATELSSYALVQTFFVRFISGILLGMASALETLCGQAYGAKQYHMMGIYMQRSWIIVFTTATLMIPAFVFSSSIFRLLGQEGKLAAEAGHIAIWFLPFVYSLFYNFTLQMFLQSQLKNIITAWLSALGFLVHLVLSWVFVYKLKWGIPGAVSALNIAAWLVIIGQLIYVMGGWCRETWTGFSRKAFSELFPVAKLSVSSGVMICLELWYNAFLILIAGYMKKATISIAAFSICLNIVAWQLMLFFGFLTASSVRVSNELGRGDAKAAKFSVRVIMTTSTIVGVFFTILSLCFGNVLSYAFTSDVEVAKVVHSLTYLLAMSVLLNSIQPVLTGVAVGAGWQAAIAYVNIGSYYIVGIPIGGLLAYVFHLGITGIWIGMISGVALQTLILIILTWRTDWDSQVEIAKARLNRWYTPKTEKPDGTISHA